MTRGQHIQNEIEILPSKGATAIQITAMRGQCSQRSGGPGGPTGKLPRRLDRTGPQFSLRPVWGHFRTAGLSEDHGTDKVRHYYAILIQGR